ncbi:SDR family NAD(P)-dependent oxidoreductase [Roseobacter sp. GAI101]|uniref:SDR family NAD(P)-dependent oxidoreductase n=1 Tax=Roseobacter sp. (strain GAI101) TaxID=391589 RepID=UPI0001871531|nr:SDR family NAD(P)-dependent oxidoreductase [Roseobacter sp. GAI101]EEB85361.1 short-chain dehydrogenase/reductase SDR [Roseobacter sp. GAI101]
MIDLTGRVAIVTGAGGGLGRAHALLLASRGARVAVNDLSVAQAQAVVDEITAAGGDGMAVAGSGSDFDAVEGMVAQVMDRWGRIDALVNNAGILRDKSFAKMALEDFRLVMDVHLMGAVHCAKAVWPHMQAQGYGRIVMTTSSSGLYGNFGQSNYGAAKMALVGLMQTLAIEGARHDIRINCIAPTAATQMLEGLLPEAELDLLQADHVSPGLLTLLHDEAPTRTILCAGAGAFATANVTLTAGAYAGTGPDTPEKALAQWEKITDRTGECVPQSGAEQGRQELAHAGYTRDDVQPN